jgi:hypothetical protein
MTWPTDTSTIAAEYCAPTAGMKLKTSRGVNNQLLWLMLGSPESQDGQRDDRAGPL